MFAKALTVTAIAGAALLGLTACNGAGGNTVSNDTFKESVSKIDTQLATFTKNDFPKTQVLGSVNNGDNLGKNGQQMGCATDAAEQTDGTVIYMNEKFDTTKYVDDTLSVKYKKEGWKVSYYTTGTPKKLIISKGGYEYWFAPFKLDLSATTAAPTETNPTKSATPTPTATSSAKATTPLSSIGIQISAFGPCASTK